MISALVCDFGGVLTTPLFQAFSAVQQEAGMPPSALGEAMARITAEDGENPLFALERGELTEEAFLVRLEGALTESVGRPVVLRDFADRYWSQLRPNEQLLDWLRSARSERGLRLALLTNNVREWEPRWRPVWGIDDLFEVVVDSAFVGMRKPDPRIYRLVLERLELPAGACLFLDDVEVNCDAARSLGMHAVQFRDSAQAIAELEAQLSQPSRSHR